MGVTRRLRNGEKVWVVDRRFSGGERYRRDAQVQTKLGAEAEERRVIDYWTANGTIKPLLVPVPKVQGEPALDDGKTWEDALKHFRAIELPKKKPSTAHGYELVIKGPGFRRWAGVPLEAITRVAINEWDATLVKTGMAPSTRRNQHIVLRSILKSVGPEEAGLLAELPNFPKLPSVGETPVIAVSADDLLLILNEGSSGKVKYCRMPAVRAAQLAFAVAAYGGLRAGEVRALRRRDVDLVRRVITIRIARSVGVEATPKSGDSREIPIADPLFDRLKDRCEGLRPDDHVCVMGDGQPWGDQGMLSALKRACTRLKIDRARYHGLRHYFATTLFGGGADARTVQGLLGHSSLEVTQRYAHFEADRARAAVGVFATQPGETT